MLSSLKSLTTFRSSCDRLLPYFRLKPMCEWLLYVENETNSSEPQLGMAGSHLIAKIRTTAAVIWSIKDDPTLCDQLQSLVTEEKFR